MPNEFDQAAVAYREARSQCQVATGDALDTAQDLEVVAVEDLINTPTVHLGEIGDKLAALADLMQPGQVVGPARRAIARQRPQGPETGD